MVEEKIKQYYTKEIQKFTPLLFNSKYCNWYMEQSKKRSCNNCSNCESYLGCKLYLYIAKELRSNAEALNDKSSLSALKKKFDADIENLKKVVTNSEVNDENIK